MTPWMFCEVNFVHILLKYAVKIIQIWKWKQKSGKKLVLFEFKYLQNKKW